MDLTLTPYQHPSGSFTLPLPAGWESIEDTEAVALIAVEPPRGPWFRANLVVTIGELAEPADLAEWQDETLMIIRQALTEFYLIDIEETELAGLPARRTLAHHTAQSDELVNAIVMEQWAVLSGNLGFTITASAAALEYAEFADVFGELARQFRPDPELRA